MGRRYFAIRHHNLKRVNIISTSHQNGMHKFIGKVKAARGLG